MSSDAPSTRYTDANVAPTTGLTRSSANRNTSSGRSAVRNAWTISRTATNSRMADSGDTVGTVGGDSERSRSKVAEADRVTSGRWTALTVMY